MEKATMDTLILWQRAEGGLVFLAGLVLFWQLGDGLAWWGAALMFFAPDLSFAAYGLGPRFGAAAYNGVHVYGFGVAVLAVGLALSLPLLTGFGALWLAHAGFDRALGYGLKSQDSFSITHLGRIGKH